MTTVEHGKEHSIVHFSGRNIADETLYSPVKVAKAIGVSESSVKRWCDSGKIAFTKTAGGHRRLNRAQIIAFLREKNYELISPSLIGLPAFDGFSVADTSDAMNQFYSALVTGDESKCRRILTYLYLNGWLMEDIADQVVAVAFEKIGTGWEHGSVAIYEERRACEICLNSLRALRLMFVTPASNAPTAIGGTVAGDNYRIPTFCAEMTLICNGWNATSLGSDLPFETLRQAALDHHPNLMWLSVSEVADESGFAKELNEFAGQLPEKTILVVGGNAITPGLRSQIKNAICCDNMSQLVASTRHLRPKLESTKRFIYSVK